MGEDLAVGGQDQDFGGGLGEEAESQSVVAPEGDAGQVGDVALQCPDPAFGGDDDGDRFALDHGRGEVDAGGVRRIFERCAAATDLGLGTEGLLNGADLLRDRLPLRRLGAEQGLDFVLLRRQRAQLALQLHLLEPAQRAQTRVEDRVGLEFGKLEPLHQGRLRLVLLADDADDLVEVEIDDEEAAEDFKPALDLGEAMARAPLQHDAAMVEPFAERIGEADHAGDQPADQHVHVERNSCFEFGEPEKRFHQDDRIDAARARLQHHPHVLGRFVAHVGQQRQFLLLEKFGELLDEPRLGDSIGDLGDHDGPGAAPEIFLGPARPHPEGAAPGPVGLGDRVRAVDQDAAGGEVGALHEGEELGRGRVAVSDQVERRVAQLRRVVRRDRGRHADGDALGAIGEQVREGRRQDDGLLLLAVIGGPEIDGVLVDPVEEQAGDFRQTRLGVAVGGRPIAVDVAEIALAVDERIALREVLREAHQRVVDRLVAVGMEVAHHVADDLRAFLEGRVRVEPKQAHAVEDAPVNGLQAVAGIRQSPVHDRRERIGEVALFERRFQLDALDAVRPGRRIEGLAHHELLSRNWP